MLPDEPALASRLQEAGAMNLLKHQQIREFPQMDEKQRSTMPFGHRSAGLTNTPCSKERIF
jgi:hypothetical protein